MVELLDLIIVGAISMFMGAITSMSGLNLGRFTVVAHVESSVPASVGTAIGITAMVTVTSVLAYLKSNYIHRKAFLTMTATGVVGCIVSSFFTVLLPSILILAMVAAIMAWSIYRIASSKSAKHSKQSVAPFDRKQYAKQYAIGMITGSLSGLIGIIFGSLVLGALVNVVKSDPKMLVGTTLALSAILSICGVAAHLAHGNMNFVLLGIMGSAGMIGGVIGSRFSTSMAPRKLKMLLIACQAGTLVYLAYMITLAVLRPAVIHCNSCF